MDLGDVKKYVSPFGQGGFLRGSDETPVDWNPSVAYGSDQWKAATQIGAPQVDQYIASQFGVGQPNIDYATQAGTRGYQADLAQQMRQAMESGQLGQTQAAANQQLGGMAQQRAMASAGGPGGSLGALQANIAGAQAGQQAGQNIGQSALSEQGQLTGLYGGLLGQMRGQDYSMGAGGQALGQQSAMFNAQQQNEMAMMMAKQQQELAAANQQMYGNQALNYDEMALQAAMANAGYNYQSNRQQKAADMSQLATAIGSWASE